MTLNSIVCLLYRHWQYNWNIKWQCGNKSKRMDYQVLKSFYDNFSEMTTSAISEMRVRGGNLLCNFILSLSQQPTLFVYFFMRFFFFLSFWQWMHSGVCEFCEVILSLNLKTRGLKNFKRNGIIQNLKFSPKNQKIWI